MLNSYLAAEKIADLTRTAATQRLIRSARRQPESAPRTPRSTWGSRLRNRFATA
jgi:anti-sigma factor RsiW